MSGGMGFDDLRLQGQQVLTTDLMTNVYVSPPAIFQILCGDSVCDDPIQPVAPGVDWLEAGWDALWNNQLEPEVYVRLHVAVLFHPGKG
ncbi:hypothetical protein OUZ56_033025 [Daphnia magna]|uniref:Uncharacterized protein n=1 Tax=Daphnia magna TaxID=35525 RepID=A0ABR0BA13_9CRUS|nr:hypothetical protein OUZ56_033025 [Daphnia magna]